MGRRINNETVQEQKLSIYLILTLYIKRNVLCTQKSNDHQTPYRFYRTHLSVGHYTTKINCTPHLSTLSFSYDEVANKYRLIAHWKQFYFSFVQEI